MTKLENMSFTCNLKKEITTKKISINNKIKLLEGYFKNNSFPIVDNNEIKLVISNIYPFVLEYIERCIQSLNLKLKFERIENNQKIGKETFYLKIFGNDLEQFEKKINLKEDETISDENAKKRLNETQSFLTGVFLSGGSMNSPKRHNHLEIRCKSLEIVDELFEIFHCFNIDTNIIFHKNKYVIYLKKNSLISDTLKIMGCTESVLTLESESVKTNFDQKVIRSNQLEIANLSKTVLASSLQIKQITVLKNTQYWHLFSEIEKKCFEIRRKNEEYSLSEIAKELSNIFQKNISRSSVQNYFKKLNKTYNDYMG